MSRIIYTMSLVLQRLVHFTTLVSYYLHSVNICLQRLLQFSTLVSYYLHYVNMCCSVYFIFSTAILLPTLCQQVLQWIPHYSALVSSYIYYVNMCCSGYFIFQQFSPNKFTMSTCAASVSPSFSTGLVLTAKYQHVLKRLLHFAALISYYSNMSTCDAADIP
jgi:hypothetical protein